MNSRKNPKGAGKRPLSGFLILIERMVDLHDRPGQDTRPLSDFRHLVLPLNGHEVYACNPFHFFEFLYLLQGEFDPFFSDLAFTGAAQSFNQRFGNIHARYLFGHIEPHTHAFHGSDTGKDVALFMKAHVDSPFYEFL